MGDVPADDYGRPGFTRRFGNSNSSSLGSGLSFWDRDFRSEHYPVGKRQNSTIKIRQAVMLVTVLPDFF